MPRPRVRCGSRLCKNADIEIDCATIESGRHPGRSIVAAKANFLNQYFVSVSKDLFLHSLGQPETFRMLPRRFARGGEADEIRAKVDMIR